MIVKRLTQEAHHTTRTHRGMFSRFLPTFRKKEEEHESDSAEDDSYEDDETSVDEEDQLDHVIEANLIPSDLEKKTLLASFEVMRRESLFCDAAFLCHGVLFRAHRVVVSSWSRWMKAFLCDSPPEEVLSMDIFEPDAFRAVLDYMYGQPLHLTVETADSILKVVRRLELQKLEQQCWRYLMTAIDPETNVAYLHELADRYDCPPLKLAAWRILKEKIPSVGSFPNKSGLVKSSSSSVGAEKPMRGTGFTGPGDPAFNSLNNVNGVRAKRYDNRLDEAENGRLNSLPSVLNDYENGKRKSRRRNLDNDDDDDEDNDEDEDEDEEESPIFEELAQRYQEVRLEDLDRDAKATDVVLAWAKRLKEVYAQCAPQADIDEDELSALRLDESAPNVQLHKFPKKSGGTNKDNKKRMHSREREAEAEEMKDTIGVTETHHSVPTRRAFIPQPEVTTPTARNHKAKPEFKLYHSAQSIDWSEVLETFYIHMNLQPKISGIPTILKTWAGREDIMIASLLQKYEKVISKDLLEYLEYVHNLAETQTESSFVKQR